MSNTNKKLFGDFRDQGTSSRFGAGKFMSSRTQTRLTPQVKGLSYYFRRPAVKKKIHPITNKI